MDGKPIGRKLDLNSNECYEAEDQGNPLYVKVKMDGKLIGRKLDLNRYESYEALVQDLNNMFRLTIPSKYLLISFLCL